MFLGGLLSQTGSPIYLAIWSPAALGLDPTSVEIREMLASPRILSGFDLRFTFMGHMKVSLPSLIAEAWGNMLPFDPTCPLESEV